MELWGGIECTINRVGTKQYDQLERSGHYTRGDDLARIASLGIRTLRYPLLWERAATARPGVYDWRFADERLPRLRALGITPIAGLVHHGSGPMFTHLLNDSFATGLADYAAQLARRFPWVEWYTPVNELLTTARFSGLYGLWYPHERSGRAFARILYNECRATVLAMRAIRAVNPAAKLVQTDDLGTIYATPPLQYQADFENHRRWLGWDLLMGQVDAGHPLYRHLVGWGIDAGELAWLRDHRCEPDLVGIDHYVTSDRFLDHRIERYPACTHGSNQRDAYADIEAVRVLARSGTSLREVVHDAAHRYHRPVALTEVHIGCTEDEQVRWLHEAWTVCAQLEASGIPLRAVTAWALLGSHDWDTLLTRGGDTYESGVFCVRNGTPRPTALAEYITAVTHRRRVDHIPALAHGAQGWWHRPERLLHGPGLPCNPWRPARDLRRKTLRDGITCASGVSLPSPATALD
jgi:dTDP-4-dehydrorhamnose reductase